MTRQGLTSYLLLLRWQFMRMRQIIVLLVLIQIALGVGIIYGFAFLVPHISPDVALFFATGAPTLSLILIGLTVVPQESAQARVNGRHLYVAALPVPRLAPMLSEVTFWLVVQLPGSIVTLLLAMARFDVRLHVVPLVVPAIVLVSLSAAAVGYAIAVSIPPSATGQVSSFLSIALLLFSPINFPLSRLPVALQDVHRVLPVTYMADIMRGSLTGHYGVNRPLAFAVVGAWCAAGLGVSAWAAARRR
jgi:ABC-2 type transport system permease protein